MIDQKTIEQTHISYCMPAYNSAATIAESVESIMNDNFENGDEIIIVNDGSTDATPEVILNLQKKYPLIKVINQENKGCPAARNVGYKLASNPLIFTLYSDDLLVPGSVSKLKKYMLENHADLAAFAEDRYFQKSSKEVTHAWVSRVGILTLADFLAGDINPGSGGDYIFTKTIWEKVGGVWEYGKGLHEAWGFTLKILANGGKFVVMPNSYYLHRYGMNSLFIRESRNPDELSLMATKMISHYLHLLNEEDAAYIISEEGSKKWFDGPNRKPIRLKTGEVGKTGYIKRPWTIKAKMKIVKMFSWLLPMYLKLKKSGASPAKKS